MKLYFEKHILYTFILAIMVIGLLGTYSCSSMLRLIAAGKLISHSTSLINNSNRVAKSVVDAEAYRSAYLLTAKKEYITSYNEAVSNMWNACFRLDSVTQDHPEEHKMVGNLKKLLEEQILWNNKIIGLKKEGIKTIADTIRLGQGDIIAKNIRDGIQEIQDTEQEIFRKRNTISEDSLKNFLYSFTSLAIGLTIIIIYLVYIINKSFKSRKNIENQLNQVAENLQDLYDHAPCGYHSIDGEGKIIEVNQTEAAWLGYTTAELRNKYFTEVLTEESREDFKKNLDKLIFEGRANTVELDLVKKDGQILPVLLSSVIYYDDENNFLYSRCSVIDNTDLKNTRKELEKSNEELESFTYSVSHDLRSPLRAITGFAQILLEDYNDKLDEEGQRINNTIIRNANHMGQLIDDLLDFSRLGRKEIARSTINMEEIVQHSINELKPMEDNERVINIKLYPLHPVQADANMLGRVWFNLLSNALKYTRKEEVTEIEIGSSLKDGYVYYYIKDNGTGFEMQYIHKLFGIFQRLHKMKDFEGTGVGLALVKSIILRHGGTVGAESKINQGATFYFTLPQTLSDNE